MAHAILLALAGLASGWLVAGPALDPLADLLGAGLLGLVLAAYLWLHAGVRSHVNLGAVALAAIVAHGVMMFLFVAASMIVITLWSYGNPTLSVATAPAGAVGAALIAAVFLKVLPSERDQFGLEIACCAILGGLAGSLWEFAGFAPVRWLARVGVWNGAVAGALGVVAHLRSRPAAARTTTLRVMAGTSLAAVCGVLVFGGSLRAALQPAPVVRVVGAPLTAIAREARLKSVNEAPPPVDLPALSSVPAPDIFMKKPIAGYACYPPHDNPLAPDTRQIESRQLRLPARRYYQLTCYPKKDGPNAPSTVFVVIVQYPNDAWARYDLRNQDGYLGVIQDRREVTRIPTHGRPIFASEKGTYWSSGDKVIKVNGSVTQEILDRFIDAYLKRYPNTLEPGFDLPYMPRT